jgi:carboxymethylenebutenolidase
VNTTLNVARGLMLVAVTGAAITGVVQTRAVSATAAPAAAAATVRSTLPSAADAKQLLNMTTRHREWIVVPVAKDTSVLAWVVYPERSDPAQVVVVKGETLEPSDWTRAVSDQLSAEGYLTVVPDVLTEVDPQGNRRTRESLDASEVSRREQAIRRAALQLADANRMLDPIELNASRHQISLAMKEGDASFPLSSATWPAMVQYLNERTGNAPVFIENPHAMHMAVMAQGAAAPMITGDIGRKDPRLPANYFTAKAAIRDSKLKAEWVDLPLEGETVKLHTLVVYPAGTAKTGVVIVMQHGVGVDEWQRALAYQIAEDGFIAVLPDLWSGTGPNGGNWDASGGFVDDAVRNAAGKVSPDEGMKRYKTAREWALKLPRANGKTGSIGFCAGGGNSFRFAAEVPELNGAVVYYGGAPAEPLMTRIQAPVLGLYGENDGRMAENVAETKVAMARLGKQYEAHVYPKTTHSFAMFQHIGTNAESIADAWPRTIAFFRRQLM